MTIAIIGAEPAEIALIKQHMTIETVKNYAGRDFMFGELFGQAIVLVLARIGKVAAAVTTTILLEHFSPELIIFTGVAGAGNSEIHIGDVIVAEYLLQHDMDVRPFRKQFEVPIHSRALFNTEEYLAKKLLASAELFLSQKLTQILSEQELSSFNITQPKAKLMTIASGDQFIKDAKRLAQLAEAIHQETQTHLGAVEMEGAAVAQVCHEYQKPCLVLRIISDNANHQAAIDFELFLQNIASCYALEIIREFFNDLSATT